MKHLEKLYGVTAQMAYCCVLAGHAFEASEQPFDVYIAWGVRTRSQQRKMVAKGLSQTKNSYHLVGDAVDMYLVDVVTGELVDGKNQRDFALYQELDGYMQKAAEQLGIIVTWGGHWKRLIDLGHWQIEEIKNVQKIGAKA